jgi:hypothetical protein
VERVVDPVDGARVPPARRVRRIGNGPPADLALRGQQILVDEPTEQRLVEVTRLQGGRDVKLQLFRHLHHRRALQVVNQAARAVPLDQGVQGSKPERTGHGHGGDVKHESPSFLQIQAVDFEDLVRLY